MQLDGAWSPYQLLAHESRQPGADTATVNHAPHVAPRKQNEARRHPPEECARDRLPKAFDHDRALSWCETRPRWLSCCTVRHQQT